MTRDPNSRRRLGRAMTVVGTATVAIASALATTVVTASGAVATTGASAKILLTLGDSLAAGYQPTDGRSPPPVDPATGLPDQGYPGGYARDLAARTHLRLVDLGCPGETTLSWSTTPAQPACGAFYRAVAGAANQEAAALHLIAGHPGQISVVTFDLGANDVDGCLTRAGVSAACVATTSARVEARLPRIVRALTTSLKRFDPGAHVVAMTYYDPFLGRAYRPGGLTGETEAALSLAASQALDASLRTIFTRAGALVAPVDRSFATGRTLPLQHYGGKLLPLNVATVCRLTWMCPTPERRAVPGADIHPNTAGYALIARAFAGALAQH